MIKNCGSYLLCKVRGLYFLIERGYISCGDFKGAYYASTVEPIIIPKYMRFTLLKMKPGQKSRFSNNGEVFTLLQ